MRRGLSPFLRISPGLILHISLFLLILSSSCFPVGKLPMTIAVGAGTSGKQHRLMVSTYHSSFFFFFGFLLSSKTLPRSEKKKKNPEVTNCLPWAPHPYGCRFSLRAPDGCSHCGVGLRLRYHVRALLSWRQAGTPGKSSREKLPLWVSAFILTTGNERRCRLLSKSLSMLCHKASGSPRAGA